MRYVIAATILMTLVSADARMRAADAASKPARIVSLNMCTDELVLRLAEPRTIASVTWLSRDPRNANAADLASRVPINHGLAEEIVPLDPDLVVAGVFTARTAVALLRQLHIPLTEFGIAKNIDDVRRDIRQMAGLVGEPEKGERLVAAMDRRLAALPPPVGTRPRAIVLNPNGATVGRGTLVDEIMTLAGLDNVAAELGIENYGTVPLETVVAHAVDILIVSAARDGPPALATEILRHPVLARLSGRVKIISVPSRLWNCGGPEAVEAIEYLRQVVNDVRRGQATQ
jgi:iron complex transport system substrate-binding protein